MATDISPLLTSSSAAVEPPARKRRLWPAWTILGVAAVSILYLQTTQAIDGWIKIFDNGTSNILTGAIFALTLILLSVWMLFFAPFSRKARYSTVGIGVAVIAVLVGLVRSDGFDGNVRPRFAWRWTPKPDEALAAKSKEPDSANSSGANGIAAAASKSIADVSPTDHDYPGFLGPNRNAYVPGVQLATDWKSQPPKLLWKHPIGAGYSAFSIVGEAAITLEQRGPQELVACYNLKTGEMIWQHPIEARHHDVIGGDGPAGTPTVHDGKVYALGGTGVLRCLDAATGEKIWIRDVLADVGTDYETDRKGVAWGRSASPLVVDDLVIAPGGGPPAGPKVSLVAYNKQTGEIVWKGGARQVSYSSPNIANYGGVPQIVIVNEDQIAAHDPKTGAVLWETPWDGSSYSTASASQTIQVADDKLFVSKGYSVGGGALFSIKHNPEKAGGEGEWTITKLWNNHRVLLTKQNNVIIKDGSVYGLSDGVLQCVDLDSGKRRWAGEDYGHGQLLRIGDVLLVSSEQGELALVELNPNEFHELTKIQAIAGKTWNNPALSGNLLLIRNAEEAACYELPIRN